MQIAIQEEEKEINLSFEDYDYIFIGRSIDDRGDKAIEYVKNHLNGSTIILQYLSIEMQLKIGQRPIHLDDLDTEMKMIKSKSILLEATTLNFTEILLVLDQAKKLDCFVSLLYLEPKSYSKPRGELIHKRDFSLSVESPGFIPIPGFTNLFKSEKNRTVFIAGYEAERIERGIQEGNVVSENCSLLFGVPAFEVGWEMNSFANNIQVLNNHSLSGEIYFASANNPVSTFEAINDIFNSKMEDEEFCLAPVGPKPAGIAIAIFAVENRNNNVTIMFDHPKKLERRTKAIGKWHLYNVKF